MVLEKQQRHDDYYYAARYDACVPTPPLYHSILPPCDVVAVGFLDMSSYW